MNRYRPYPFVALVGVLFACERPADEFRTALPDRETVEVQVPEADQTARGLSQRSDALVGEPANFYTSTYYEARKINALGVAVVRIVETIAAYPATEIDERHAVWGPFSEEREPNEFKLTIQKVDADEKIYVWAIQGRHKSQTELLTIARGAFEPAGDNLGRGWFALDLDAIHELDPSENGRGHVAYAFERTADGVSVRVHFEGRDEGGETVEAGYAYGEDTEGNGFVLFAFPENINDEPLKENVLIRTRWNANGAGRADIVAVGGDLEGDTARGSQCWGKTFVSTYESFALDGVVFAESGDVDSCVLDRIELPTDGELPTETDVQDPHEGIAID